MLPPAGSSELGALRRDMAVVNSLSELGPRCEAWFFAAWATLIAQEESPGPLDRFVQARVELDDDGRVLGWTTITNTLSLAQTAAYEQAQQLAVPFPSLSPSLKTVLRPEPRVVFITLNTRPLANFIVTPQIRYRLAMNRLDWETSVTLWPREPYLDRDSLYPYLAPYAYPRPGYPRDYPYPLLGWPYFPAYWGPPVPYFVPGHR